MLTRSPHPCYWGSWEPEEPEALARNSLAGASGSLSKVPLQAEWFQGKGQRLAEQTFLQDQGRTRGELDAGPEMAGGDEKIVPTGNRAQERQAIRAARSKTGPGAFEVGPG